MLEVVHGQTRNREVARRLSQVLQGIDIEGTLYIGFPVLATADETITVDALLVSHQHSIVVFSFGDNPPPTSDVPAWERLKDEQDRLLFAVEANLRRHDTLRAGRKLSVEVNTATIFPTSPQPPETIENSFFTDLDNLESILDRCPPMGSQLFRPLQAALQRVTTIKPRKKREGATKPDSRGSVMKQIERGIANLDQWQKRAAIESPEGPQRIRGLAGSGKTVVLALKAAYLHARHPEWIIAVTFFTRSLYQQFEDLIRRFSFEHRGDEPNWENLRIRHAWGGVDRDGIYTEIAAHCGAAPRDFLYGRSRYGRNNAFEGVCREVLSATSAAAPDPLYDAVLIDEAQDLPASFFRLVHRFTRYPKRIVWAYDDLQKLSETDVPTVEELFGRDEHGDPRVHLANEVGQPQQDIVLPVCYRNPPWALTVAHGLGLGTQRPEGLVQHFDDPSMWTEIGYQVVAGSLEANKTVTLERSPVSYPDYFKELLKPEDVIISRTFDDEYQQADWVAQSILQNIEEDQLEHDDILVVLPNGRTARQDAVAVMEELARRGINSHLAGVTTSQDEIFRRESVALANIYRSKGNEAAMVYILNAQYCVSGHELITLRNTLFTAISRSRAWVRICGWGPDMAQLQEEIRATTKNSYRLRFRIPTPEELARIRQIHRELTADERARLQRAEQGLRSFLEALERGEIAVENLPVELRAAVARYFGTMSIPDEDTEPDSDRAP